MPRVGSKRSDRRWKSPDGTVWASKFEYQVFTKFAASGRMARKCEQGSSDTFAYTTPVRNGQCAQCGSGQIVQARTYTPDVRVDYLKEDGTPACYYIEAKGYFPSDKRGLLRYFAKQRPDIDLRIVAYSDHWVTKGRSRLSDYVARYLKTVPIIFFNNRNPDRWVIPTEWE